jgi:hypothetical protein
MLAVTSAGRFYQYELDGQDHTRCYLKISHQYRYYFFLICFECTDLFVGSGNSQSQYRGGCPNHTHLSLLYQADDTLALHDEHI